MNYKSLRDLSSDLIQNIHKIPHDIDLVVGVPRSGLMVANLIALLLNVQITDVDGLLSDHIITSGKTKTKFLGSPIRHVSDCKKILVVEDSVYSGASLLSVKQRIQEQSFSFEILYFAAYVSPGKEDLVDVYLQTLPSPRVFEWNLFHSSILEYSCVDIDGILCVDPTEEENDDGENYLYFLEHAAPKIIPTHRIKYLVSSRLETYRSQTEQWLARNHIEYDKLFLLNSTAEKRRAKGLHAAFKSEIYGKADHCGLFIESSSAQAQRIYAATGKPVYCIENNVLYDEKLQQAQLLPVAPVSKRRRSLRSFLSRCHILRKIYRRIKKR